MRLIAVNDGEMNRGRSGNRPGQASVLSAVTSTLNRDGGLVVDCRRRMDMLSIGCPESNCYCMYTSHTDLSMGLGFMDFLV